MSTNRRLTATKRVFRVDHLQMSTRQSPGLQERASLYGSLPGMRTQVLPRVRSAPIGLVIRHVTHCPTYVTI